MILSLKKNPVSNFSSGFLYPFRAGTFIKGHPVLLKYIIVPFIINVVVLSGAIYWGLSFFNSIAVHYIPQGDAWSWVFLSYFVWTAAIFVPAGLRGAIVSFGSDGVDAIAFSPPFS